MNMHHQTILDALQAHASAAQPKALFSWTEDGETVVDSLDASELDNRARRVARWLRGRGEEGDCVLLAFPPGLAFIVAFFGCLYARRIAIPAYPPEARGKLPRLASILRDSGARLVLTTRARLDLATAGFGRAGADRPIDVVDLETAEAGDPLLGPIDVPAATIAFLQYTSGSTADPKGVMVTHANVIANVRAMLAVSGLTREMRCVSWLPHYHDMGLIGTVLQTAYVGCATYLMSPFAFVQKPSRFLLAISRFKANLACSPNFGYEHCVHRVKDDVKAKLDLSAWTIAQCGAEPIRKESLERFAEAFAQCGFRRSSFFPGYGLAEATLMVSCGHGEAFTHRLLDRQALREGRAVGADAAEGAQAVWSCGAVGAGFDVRIVCPDTKRELSAGLVGEIWVRGPSVAAGYWRNANATRETFGAVLPGAVDEPFLRTGDLAFRDGAELFVTGRMKDVIIVDGRNHYPQDIEHTVEGTSSLLRVGGGAAFAFDVDGRERVVIVHEVDIGKKPDAAALNANIRRAVAEVHDLSVSAIILVRPGAVPKTSSGKTMRGACRELFENGELTAYGAWCGADALAPRMARLVASANRAA